MTIDKFSQLTDEKLIECVQFSGDETALDILLTRYKPLVRSRIRPFYVEGGDYNDLLQEGMIALYKAIGGFDLASETSFAAYASVCIRHRIIDYIAGTQRQKHQPLNEAVDLNDADSIDFTTLESNIRPLEDIAGSLIAEEFARELQEYVDVYCSDLERKVLIYYMRYQDVEQVANVLGLPQKSVENALYRARQKLRDFFDI
ncbi:MAG TPA: sigma-70 family RNA polymerase sigma factor [Clostridiaceae bacterium]|nr:sigma-70 family RNA polymerase sigma factor [Clostridiaceae bacterium]